MHGILPVASKAVPDLYLEYNVYLSVKGKVTYAAEYKRKYYPIEFVIVNERAPALLGLETSIGLGLEKRVNLVDKQESVLDEFKDVFQGLGRLKQNTVSS